MFKATTTPDGGMNYWRNVGIDSQRLRARMEQDRAQKSEQNRRMKKANKERRQKAKENRRFRNLVRLAAKDRLRSSTKTKRDSIEYSAWRKAVFNRDGYTCTKCGSTGNIIVHHIKSWACYPTLRLKASNGITLCTECHAIYHDWLSESQESRHLRSIQQEDLCTLYLTHHDLKRLMGRVIDESIPI